MDAFWLNEDQFLRLCLLYYFILLNALSYNHIHLIVADIHSIAGNSAHMWNVVFSSYHGKMYPVLKQT